MIVTAPLTPNLLLINVLELTFKLVPLTITLEYNLEEVAFTVNVNAAVFVETITLVELDLIFVLPVKVKDPPLAAKAPV